MSLLSAFLVCPVQRGPAQMCAVGLALWLAGCSATPAPPTPASMPVEPAPSVAESPEPTPKTATNGDRAQLGAVRSVALDRIDSTQRVRVATGQRCGPRITRSLPPPSTLGRMFGWMGVGQPSSGELPAPDFQTEVQCTDQAERQYSPAQYRLTYHVGDETHSVDSDEAPARHLQIDEAGQPVHRAAPITAPATAQ